MLYLQPLFENNVICRCVHSLLLAVSIQAREREKYLKSGDGKRYLKQNWSHSSVGYPPTALGPKHMGQGAPVFND
jgi:hypothetical protein